MTVVLKPHERILCALDTNDLNAAKATVRSLAPNGKPLIGGVKLGLDFFPSLGPPAVTHVVSRSQIP